MLTVTLLATDKNKVLKYHLRFKKTLMLGNWDRMIINVHISQIYVVMYSGYLEIQ